MTMEQMVMKRTKWNTVNKRSFNTVPRPLTLIGIMSGTEPFHLVEW